MLTQAEENYVKEIFALEEDHNKSVSTNDLAEKLNTKPSSVTDMLRKLSAKNIVVYTKYKGTNLSQLGRKKAIEIIRKHRLWETFLVEMLQFSWDEVHEIAEQLEHIQSEPLINKLDAFLGHPHADPHGDPIPDQQGRFQFTKQTSLADLKIGSQGVLVSVKDSSAPFLHYLNKNQIALGDLIQVVDIEPFDRSFKIEHKSKRMVISENIARNLYLYQ